MVRRRKGRAISGWVIIDKPAGWTSTAVVNKVKWAFQAQKAGHAGTLDPDAKGVLAVALGEATKTVPFITDALKAYEFMVKFGEATSTDDAEGEVISRSAVRPSGDEIKDALHAFVGDIEQVPPKFSAIKIDGQRAYALAREGEDITLSARPLYVDSLILNEQPDADHAILEMVCGKGGYVRSIARDLGAKLGCYGHVQWLRRTWSGPFDLDQAVSLETIENLARSEEIDAHLLPLELGLTDLPMVSCAPEAAARLRNGNPAMVIGDNLEYGDECWASCDGEPIAVGVFKAGGLHPTRVFVRPEKGA